MLMMANRLLLSAIAASVATASASSSSLGCEGADALLFAYFQGDERLYYAFSYDGLHWANLNNGTFVMQSTISGTSIRDPYVFPAGDRDGYRMVSTNGHNFGGVTNILTWYSPDLITWENETLVDVMGAAFFPAPAKVTDTWAPEFKWDELASSYMVL